MNKPPIIYPPSHSQLNVKNFDDAVVPAWAPDNLLTTVASLKTRESDVIVQTFPKAGTTWMLQIVHLILNQGRQGEEPLNEVIVWLERDSKRRIDGKGAPRIIKTHLPTHRLPKNYLGKTIYVARRPDDIAVSYFHHARSKADLGFIGNWETFLNLFLDGQVEGGDWYQHTLKAKQFSENSSETTLFIWYENIHEDIYKAIRRIASFLDVDLPDQIITSIAQKSSFEYMRSSVLTNVKWSAERANASPHLRRGRVGEGAEALTASQQTRLREKWPGAENQLDMHIPGP